MNNPVNMVDEAGNWPKIIKAIGNVVGGVLMFIGAAAAAGAATTAGAAIAAVAGAIIAIATIVVGVAQAIATTVGVKDEDVDKINIKDNIINSVAGEKNGKIISSAIDVGTIGMGAISGVNSIITNSKPIINSSGKLLSNMKSNLKNPVTYMEAWDNYSTAGSMVEGLHTLNLISDKTYNKLIKIFDPEI